jgi:AcrR family transcriptional regulator
MEISGMDNGKKEDGFARRTRQTKAAILSAARSLFLSRGPLGTSIADIAREAGVSQVSIYNHFDGKDALLAAVVREQLDAQLTKAEAVLDLELPFTEKVARIFALGAAEDQAVTDESLANFDWADPKIQAIYDTFLAERQVPFILRFVDMGKKDGAIKEDLSGEAVVAYMEAFRHISRDPDLLQKGRDYLASLSHLFFYGILGKAAH